MLGSTPCNEDCFDWLVDLAAESRPSIIFAESKWEVFRMNTAALLLGPFKRHVFKFLSFKQFNTF